MERILFQKMVDVILNNELTIENKKPSSYAYCSDTKYCESIIEKIKGVSLLYHENFS